MSYFSFLSSSFFFLERFRLLPVARANGLVTLFPSSAVFGPVTGITARIGGKALLVAILVLLAVLGHFLSLFLFVLDLIMTGEKRRSMIYFSLFSFFFLNDFSGLTICLAIPSSVRQEGEDNFGALTRRHLGPSYLGFVLFLFTSLPS